MSDERVAANQAEVDQAFERVKKSGFLKSAKKTAGTQVQTLRQERTGRTVVVEKRSAPRITREQVRAKLAADEAQKKEKLMADAARKRQEDEAGGTLRNKSLSLEQRIAAAEVLGFSITFRGPEDRPRKIVFRNGGERIHVMLPRGKNKRREMRQGSWH